MKTAQKWVISLLVALIVTLFGFAGLMFILDPLLQYRKETPLLTYYEYSERYSNPGIAQHYVYDTVLVGTSMIENMDVDEFDSLLGTKAVRLPYSGGTARNMKIILDVCFSSNNNIKTVYWALDEHQLFANPEETRHPLPDYLYREDIKEDASYLLNLDIFYSYVCKDILETLRGKTQPAERRHETLFGTFGKEETLKAYDRPPVSGTKQDENVKMDKVKANMERNICPVIRQHPETKFVFYFVPYSILYWDIELRTGGFETTMNAVEDVIGELLTYDNVSVYFYHDERDVITNLDNYKDYSHYGKWINSYLIQALASGEKKMTRANYRQLIEEMKEFILNYDFEAIFK